MKPNRFAEVFGSRVLWFILAGLLIGMGAIASASASDQIPAPPQKQPIALIGATIHPVDGPEIADGTILFDKGRIVALGTNVSVPAAAIKIEVTGKHIYPGLIEANTQLGLVEIGAVRATRDFAEVGGVNPNVRAAVAVNPESELFPVTRANGIALAVSRPSGGLIAGQAALLVLDGWTWEDMTLKSPVGMMLNWPRMTVNTAWWARQTPEQQREQMQKNLAALDQTMREAKAYKIAREAAATKGVPFHAFDARWEAMIPVLKGEVPFFVEADELKQIEAAVDWAGREGVKIVIIGGADAGYVTDLLKSHDVAVIVTPVLSLPSRRDEPFDAAFTLPLRLYNAGVKFCIAGGSGAGNERNTPYHAARAASYGLPKDLALKAITQFPAEILGVADRVGTLAPGKDATLIVTTGDPLEIPTQIEQLYLQGRKIDLSNKQRTLYEKYSEKYRQQERQ